MQLEEFELKSTENDSLPYEISLSFTVKFSGNQNYFVELYELIHVLYLHLKTHADTKQIEFDTKRKDGTASNTELDYVPFRLYK